jgi:hypothetical protein
MNFKKFAIFAIFLGLGGFSIRGVNKKVQLEKEMAQKKISIKQIDRVVKEEYVGFTTYRATLKNSKDYITAVHFNNGQIKVVYSKVTVQNDVETTVEALLDESYFKVLKSLYEKQK